MLEQPNLKENEEVNNILLPLYWNGVININHFIQVWQTQKTYPPKTPKPLYRSPKSKSKSKSRLTTGFSLKSDFPTTHPATRESFKEARYSNISKTKVVSIY